MLSQTSCKSLRSVDEQVDWDRRIERIEYLHGLASSFPFMAEDDEQVHI